MIGEKYGPVWRILARLRHHSFGSVQEVNLAMTPLLERLNTRPFQKLPGSRASAFVALDAPALLPLPLQPYEFAVFKSVKVHIDYHVEVEGHRYSVPHALVGQTLEARCPVHWTLWRWSDRWRCVRTRPSAWLSTGHP